jgi:hypothetical protein
MEKGYACDIHVETTCSESVVKLESVDEVDGAGGCVVGAAGGVNVGREQELSCLDRIEDDIVEKQNLVELDAIAVDGCESSVSYVGEESDALETLLSVGKSDVGEGAEIKVFGDDGRVACFVSTRHR